MKEDLLNIINHFGLTNQLKKLSEEVFELQEAILTDAGDKECYDHIVEEMADVYVVMEQLEEYFEVNQDKLIAMESYKIRRTLERIKNGNLSKN